MLSQNREALRVSGVHYPESITGRMGQYEVPWAIKGWNLRLLNADLTHQRASAYLEMFVRDAVAAQAEVLLLSSEDFSLLTQREWDLFFANISEAFAEEDAVLVECTIAWTRRPVAAMAQSSYATLVLLGLSFDFRSVKRHLERHVRHVYRQIRRLRTNGEAFALKLHSMRWRRDGFPQRWVQEFLPQVDTSILNIVENQVNVSRPLHDSESLAIDNRARSVHFDKNDLFTWPKFHDEASIQRQRHAREAYFARK